MHACACTHTRIKVIFSSKQHSDVGFAFSQLNRLKHLFFVYVCVKNIKWTSMMGVGVILIKCVVGGETK